MEEGGGLTGVDGDDTVEGLVLATETREAEGNAGLNGGADGHALHGL